MLTLVTAPIDSPVALSEAKAQLAITQSAQDAFIGRLIAAATAKLDGERGLLGRALLTQVWRLTLDYFPAAIEVPLPPLQTVDEITYRDTAGDTQTLAESEYAVLSAGGPKRARIIPAFGKSWPATYDFPESVAITFTAGYGDDNEDVPEPIRAAILMHVGHLFANRETTIVDESARLSVDVTPYGFDDLIAPFRIWSFGA